MKKVLTIDSCGRTLSHVKHCSFLCISGQSLSLLYQDVCPAIRLITSDFLFELQSRWENSSGGIAIPSSGWRVSEGHGLGGRAFHYRNIWVYVAKEDGGRSHYEIIRPPETLLCRQRGICLAGVQSNPVVMSTASGQSESWLHGALTSCVRPWVSCLTSLGPGFLNWKTRISQYLPHMATPWVDWARPHKRAWSRGWHTAVAL